jgi:mannosyltransferase
MNIQTVKPKSTFVWLVLLACILLGATFRFYHLDGESLWNDELESWRQSSFSTLDQVLMQGSIPDTHPPLFQITLFFVERYLGSSETMLRLPSAIAGTLTIAVMFWLGNTVFGQKEGLISAFFTAVLWVPISYSQEARNYSFLILFSAVSGCLWMQIALKIQRDEQIGFWLGIGYVLGALLECYTHYFGLFLILLQGIGLLGISLIRRRNRVRVIALYASILVGYLPWLPFAILQFTHTDLISWIHKPTITFFPAFITFLFNRLKPIGILALVSYAFLFVVVLSQYFEQLPPRSPGTLFASAEFLLGYWLLIPILITYLVSLLTSPVLTQRNLLISLPPAYVLLSRAITRLPKRLSLQLGFVGIFGVLPLFHMIFILGYYHYPYKEQFREAVKYVVDHSDTSQNETIIGYAKYPDYFDYYFQMYSSDYRVEILTGEEKDIPILEQYIAQHRTERFWYLSAHGMPPPAFVDTLESEFLLLDEKSFQGAHVWKFAVSKE